MSTVRTTSRWLYPLDAGGNNFIFDNLALTAGDVLVTLYDSEGNELGPLTYAVTGVGNNGGGTVVFASDFGPIAGAVLAIELAAPRVTVGGDPQDYIQDPAKTRQFNQDQRLLVPQQLWNKLLRTVMFSPLDNQGWTMPPPAKRAGKLFGFDGVGGPALYVPTDAVPVPVEVDNVVAVGLVSDIPAMPDVPPSIAVQGYATQSDGGAGILNYDPLSTAKVDNALVFPAITGRYIRPVDGILHSKWFGLLHSTTADQSARMQNFLWALSPPASTPDKSYIGMLDPGTYDCMGATLYLERNGQAAPAGDGSGFYQTGAQLVGAHRRLSIIQNANLVIGTARWKSAAASGTMRLEDFRLEGRMHIQNVEGNSHFENLNVTRAELDTMASPMNPDFPTSIMGFNNPILGVALANITAITKANPGQVTTAAAHGFVTNARVQLNNIVGMTELNSINFVVTVLDATNFTLGVNTTALTAYVAGGTAQTCLQRGGDPVLGLAKQITAITQANPGKVTVATAHGYATGNKVYLSNIIGMKALNLLTFSVTVLDATNFTLGVDTTAFAPYITSGTAQLGTPWKDWASDYMATMFASNHPLFVNFSYNGKAGVGIPSGDYRRGFLQQSNANARFIMGTAFGCNDAVVIAGGGAARAHFDGFKFEECEACHIWAQGGIGHIFSTYHRLGLGHGLAEPLIKLGIVGKGTVKNVKITNGIFVSDQDDTTRLINAITLANPGQITFTAAHGFLDGDYVYLTDIIGTDELNEQTVPVTVVSTTSITIGIDTTAFTPYVSGGTAYRITPRGTAIRVDQCQGGHIDDNYFEAYSTTIDIRGGNTTDTQISVGNRNAFSPATPTRIERHDGAAALSQRLPTGDGTFVTALGTLAAVTWDVRRGAQAWINMNSAAARTITGPNNMVAGMPPAELIVVKSNAAAALSWATTIKWAGGTAPDFAAMTTTQRGQVLVECQNVSGVAGVKTVSGVTQAAAAVVTTVLPHGYAVGNLVQFLGVGGMTQLNGRSGLITAVTSTTFTVAIDTTAFTAFTSGGTVTANELTGRFDIRGV